MDVHDKLRAALAGLHDAEKAAQDCRNAVHAAETAEALARKKVDEARAKVVRELRVSGANVASDGVTWRRVCYSVDLMTGKLVASPDSRLRLDQD